MAWLVHPQIHAKGRDHPYLSGAQTQAGKGGSPSMLRVAAGGVLGRSQLTELERTDLGAGGAQEETQGERCLLGVGVPSRLCVKRAGGPAAPPTHPRPKRRE